MLRTLAPTLMLIALALSCCWSDPQPINGYIRSVPQESAAARESRHKEVAQKREGPVVIVHRGGYAFAPENTLEAYNAVMNYGADGVEIDVRRSADGILYMLHDRCLDRVTDDFGPVDRMTYYELLSADLKRYGAANAETRIPTFAAVLELARKRCMMLEVDVKDQGIEDDIAALLDTADAWDHVVNFSAWNADKLLANPRFKQRQPTQYLPDGRRDMDPELLRPHIPKPATYVVVDDPRLIAQMMGRQPLTPVPMPDGLRMQWQPSPHTSITSKAALDSTSDQLLAVLKTDLRSRSDLEGAKDYQDLRAEKILNRAYAAYQLGQLGRLSTQQVCWLEYQVTHRSLHRDWDFNGLDGAVAAKALAACGSTESVPVLINRYKTTDPELAKLQLPGDTEHPISWNDSLIQKWILEALGYLPCEASKQFLLQYLAMDDEASRQLGYPRLELAAISLLHQDLTQLQIETLLKHPNSGARGNAIQYCLDHPSSKRDAALKAAAPWSLLLPRIKQ